MLFRERLKGYCRAPKLCRLWILRTFDESRKRGEFFVVHVDPLTGEKHNGLFVFSHFCTIEYVSIHKPGMSVLFDSNGAIKSTSVLLWKIRDYIWAHARAMARRCHDMAKQMYEIKTHAVPAWNPLREYLFRDPTYTTTRTDRLLKFSKTDEELHVVVAKCLWRLAKAPHHPWGVNSLQPHVYSDIHVTKKVKPS